MSWATATSQSSPTSTLGYAGPNLPLPIGVRAAIDAEALTIELLEGAVE
jgi:hypothetical protein